MSLQSLAVLLPYTDTPIINAQLGTLRRLPTTPNKPIGLRWARRRLVVTNAAPRRQEPRKEISLDQHDLMALEFGRLLGESKEQTISKVLRRKIDPASTYIGIEKQAKSGKEIISKNDFAVKVERSKRSSVNDSTLGPDLPRLASRPSRQNGLSINLPNKLGTKVASQVDTEEIFDDSLLRKPSPNQGSRAAIPQSPFALPVVNNVERLDSQFTTVVEETIEDLEMLRRPSAATGQGLGDQAKGNNASSLPKAVTRTPSQKLPLEAATISENSDSIEASKLEFQRLLDKSLGSNASSLTKAVPRAPSQKFRPEVVTILENSQSMEASKLEFQCLLDKSFNNSPARNLSNLASPSVRQNNVSREAFEIAQQDSRLELSSPRRPRLPNFPLKSEGDQPIDEVPSPSMCQSKESFELQDDKSFKALIEDSQNKLDVAPALPDLASSPSRHRGSIGTFVEPARARYKATPSFMKSTTMDETLLRKPRNQESDNVSLLPTQHSEEFHNPQVDQSLTCSKANIDEPSTIPSLAAPPSRHRGSFGTFVKPGRAKIRGIPAPSKEIVDEGLDEYLVQKPSVSEKGKDNMDSTSLAEANTTLPSPTKQVQVEDKIIDGDLLRRPLMEADTRQTDVRVSVKSVDLQQNEGTSLGEKALQLKRKMSVLLVSHDNALEEELLEGDKEQGTLKDNAQNFDVEKSVQVTNGPHVVQDAAFSTDSEQNSEPFLKIESQVQPHEELPQPRNSNSLDGAGCVSNGVLNVSSPGGLLEIDHNVGAKSVKVAALKKPVRVSSSDSAKGSASEGKSVLLDSLQDSGLSSDVTKQSSDSNVKGEERGSGKLYIDRDLKTLERVREVEGIVGSQSLAEPLNTTSFLPEQASFEDQNRDQTVHEQLTEVLAADQTRESILDEASHTEIVSAAKGTAPTATQSKKVLRRPSQLTNAELVAQHSEQMDLQDSNIKLHQAKEEEEKDWARAEALLKAKEQVEVKLIGSNSGGLFVSFGCLVGFLPLFELSPKRGIIDFGSWAQQKGIDSSQKGGLSNGIVNDAGQASTITQNVENNKPTTVTGEDLNELRNTYKEEVLKLMSSFVGEKTKVIVKLLDKSTRKLKFSEKEADPGCREHVQKKANLMAELKLGDVVTCEVKSITPIGVFVEVDGVPALIHHSEVSWNTRVDPAALLNVGEVIKAKVCRLDRILQRISLSLKQMQLDPLKRTLESVVGDSDNDIESMEVVWPELEDLMKQLEQMDHISCVSRGRCLYSSAFAPTFQVLISTPQSNGYKLLARFGNKIQEVLVDTTLDRDKMKECIRLCTFSEA